MPVLADAKPARQQSLVPALQPSPVPELQSSPVPVQQQSTKPELQQLSVPVPDLQLCPRVLLPFCLVGLLRGSVFNAGLLRGSTFVVGFQPVCLTSSTHLVVFQAVHQWTHALLQPCSQATRPKSLALAPSLSCPQTARLWSLAPSPPCPQAAAWGLWLWLCLCLAPRLPA